MGALAYASCSATAVFCGLLVFAEYRENRVLKVTSKPLASMGFLATALFGGALDSTYGQWVLGALVLCFAGDVFLLSRDRRWFLVGLGSFLLGHLVFVGAFVFLGALNLASGAALLVLVPVAAAAARWLWADVSGGMRLAVVAYIAVITTMVAAAIGAAAALPDTAVLLVLGAVLFFFSDLFVARDRFKVRDFRNKLWGLPLYFAGTTLLALSVAA